MTTPTLVSVDPKKIVITWVDVTADADVGRDPIIFYSVEWDQGLGTANAANWVALNTNGTDNRVTTFTHNSATVFTPNINVNYRVRPLNSVGWGPYSGYLSVLTDTYPLSMPSPTLFSCTPYQIVLNWTDITADAQTGRDLIIYYQVSYRKV